MSHSAPRSAAERPTAHHSSGRSPAAKPSDAHARVEARFKLLEIEAQVQRTALAADLTQWEQRQPLAWLGTAATIAGTASKALANNPSVRWLLVGTAWRLIRRWL